MRQAQRPIPPRRTAPRGTGLRATLVLGAALAVGVPTAILGATTASALARSGVRADLLDELVLAAVCAAGAAVTLWYALSALVVLLAGRPNVDSAGLLRACRRWGAPGVRRLAATAAMTGLGLSLGSGALATTTSAPEDLTWGSPALAVHRVSETVPTPGATAPTAAPEQLATPTPGPAAASSSTPAPAPSSTQSATPPTAPAQTSAPAQTPTQARTPAPQQSASASARPAPPTSPETRATAAASAPASSAAAKSAASDGSERPTGTQSHRVRPGDTLWSLAAADLPAGASDADIVRDWHRWYELNRSTIGADPDRLTPGQILQRPTAA